MYTIHMGDTHLVKAAVLANSKPLSVEKPSATLIQKRVLPGGVPEISSLSTSEVIPDVTKRPNAYR